MTARRKREITGLSTNATSRIWSNSRFPPKDYALSSWISTRSIVTTASQLAAAVVSTTSGSLAFDSASRMPRSRMHSAIVSVVCA
jgi:hypothetical protein